MAKVRVEALHDLMTTFPDIGMKRRGERFQCEAWLAKELSDQGSLKLLETLPGPKADAALLAGPQARSQSSQAGQASRKNR